jgi:predicted RNase H-like nuclease
MVLGGIDLAWQSKTNPTALAIGRLQEGALTLVETIHGLFSVESVLDELRRHTRLQGIAIDAPLVIKNRSGQRECERLIGREYGSRKASCHTSNLTRYPEPDSTRLSRSLETDGFRHLGSADEKWQLECYPHPALIEIF